jgi:hypothetical protein
MLWHTFKLWHGHRACAEPGGAGRSCPCYLGIFHGRDAHATKNVPTHFPKNSPNPLSRSGSLKLIGKNGEKNETQGDGDLFRPSEKPDGARDITDPLVSENNVQQPTRRRLRLWRGTARNIQYPRQIHKNLVGWKFLVGYWIFSPSKNLMSLRNHEAPLKPDREVRFTRRNVNRNPTRFALH